MPPLVTAVTVSVGRGVVRERAEAFANFLRVKRPDRAVRQPRRRRREQRRLRRHARLEVQQRRRKRAVQARLGLERRAAAADDHQSRARVEPRLEACVGGAWLARQKDKSFKSIVPACASCAASWPSTAECGTVADATAWCAARSDETSNGPLSVTGDAGCARTCSTSSGP
jgi:hypothetical protein